MLAELVRLYETRRLDEAWAMYEGGAQPGDPEWHLYGALTAWRMGERHKGRVAVERGLRGIAAGSVLGRLRFVAGSLYCEIGDPHVAVDYFTALSDGWGEYPELRATLEAPALHNLGLTYRQLKRAAEAVQCYRQAAVIFAGQCDGDGYRQARQNQAWVLCEKGDWTEAEQVLSQCEADARSGQAFQQQRLGEAFVSLVKGDVAEVLELTTAILDSAEASPDVSAQSAWLRGRAHLLTGNRSEAVAWAAVARDIAAETGLARLINDATTLLVEARKGAA